MALPQGTIISSADPIEVSAMVMAIYTQPGFGKTTLGFSANKPLLLDFDLGAHRTEYRGDHVKIDDWRIISQLEESDLEPYNTIVVDTVGRCLESLTLEIIRSNRKMSRGDGQLSQQGYGALKSRFQSWLTLLRSYGKDVVLLAHQKEDTRGDTTVMRPDIVGSSGPETYRVSDAVGYGYFNGKKRILEFNPADTYAAKSPIRTEAYEVPDFEKRPELAISYLASIISDMRSGMGSVSAAGMIIAERIQEILEQIAAAKTADDLNAIVKLGQSEERAVWASVRRKVHARAGELSIEWDQSAGEYLRNREIPEDDGIEPTDEELEAEAAAKAEAPTAPMDQPIDEDGDLFGGDGP